MGHRFIVEMQIGRQEHFIKRVIYYLSMVIADSAHKGEDWDFNFPNLYSLNFLNYDLCFGKGNDGVVQYLCLCNEEHPEIKYDYLNLVFVRLARFNKSIKECNSFQDKPLFTLCNAHILKEKPKELEGEFFDRIFEIARITNFSAEELSEYEASRMNMLDYNASMKFARKEGVAIGTAIGRDEGVAIGTALGRDEGITLGEIKGVLQTACKMKAKGLNIALIAEITGLSEAEIEGLD
jgi:predicted transposase/invertase (TIGR01784 family)